MFRRQSAQADAPRANVYQMRQQIFAIGDDFWVENGAGQRVFKVDGKALRIRKTLVLEDAAGNERYTIKEQLVTIRDTMGIEGPSGKVATIKKALISPLRERCDVHFENGAEWKVKGNLVDHEYDIESAAGTVAKVGKKWFRVRDTYGIEVSPGQDDALVLAVAIVVDQMAHPRR